MEREIIEINGKKYLRIDSLNLNEQTRLKLFDLLSNVIETTATPEMLEASARIAELLLKY